MTDTHWTPLPMPPTAPASAGDRERAGRRHAEIGDPDRERAEEEQRLSEARCPKAVKTQLPTTMPTPQADSSAP